MDGLFVHVPFVPVSVEFSCGVPEIAGRTVLAGLPPATTTAVAADVAVVDPSPCCRHAEPDRVSVVRCGQLVLRAVRSGDDIAAASVGRTAEPGVLVLGRVALPVAALACEHLPDAGGADGPRRRGIDRLRLGRGETGADGRDGNDERRRGGERGPVRPTTPSFENSVHLSPLRFPCERRSRAFGFCSAHDQNPCKWNAYTSARISSSLSPSSRMISRGRGGGRLRYDFTTVRKWRISPPLPFASSVTESGVT